MTWVLIGYVVIVILAVLTYIILTAWLGVPFWPFHSEEEHKK